jgi:hypothetical protein
MSHDRSSDDQLDTLAHALPGWLARRTRRLIVHLIGWATLGLGYVVGFAAFLLPFLVPGWLLDNAEWYTLPSSALGKIVLMAATIAVAFTVVTLPLFLVVNVIVSAGAYLIDPDGIRDLGALAAHRWLLSAEGRRLREAGAERNETLKRFRHRADK